MSSEKLPTSDLPCGDKLQGNCNDADEKAMQSYQGVENQAFETDDTEDGSCNAHKEPNVSSTGLEDQICEIKDHSTVTLNASEQKKEIDAGNELVTCGTSGEDKKDEGFSSDKSDKLHKAKKVETSLKKWVNGTNFIVYVSHFLSAWGDRMWSFGVGLFLVNIASQDLQLPAVYGLATSLTIFFLGATVGHWVDNTPRLKAAQLSLILQNVFVVVCAGGVYAYLWLKDDITLSSERGWLVPLCQAGIIAVAIFSSLASLARVISVERDWIVEICGKDRDLLAKMTASLRRIDQCTLILAPIATGQIMTYAGLKNGAIFIAAWNVGSVFVEYFLMWKVYNTVPALKAKKSLCRADEIPDQEAETKLTVVGAIEDAAKDEDGTGDAGSPSQTNAHHSPGESNENILSVQQLDDETEEKGKEGKTEMEAQEEVAGDKKKEEEEKTRGEAGGGGGEAGCCCQARVFTQFRALYRGWRTYMKYSVAMAGLALACLYMTVLGFDNITVAYAVTQGLSESILGILMGVSAVFGILGTFAYPVLRRRLGLVRTGIFALSTQVLCLTLCVASVWMPGSPFDPLYYINPPQGPPACGNSSAVQSSMGSVAGFNASLPSAGGNVTDCPGGGRGGPESYLSVGMLMAGIVTARFGLWTADLAITQLFMEAVSPGERGVVNGVQSSLNKLMDVLKFVIVVAVPDIPTFGYLIVISFLFICLGWLSYAIFLRKNRGHFFHFEKCAGCASENGQVVSQAA